MSDLEESSMSCDKDETYQSLLGHLSKENQITVGATLGKGTFSCVVVATKKDVKYALKIIDTRSRSEYVKRFLPREIELVRVVVHPNIVRVYEVLSVGAHVNFLTEYCEGGDVLQKIQKQKRIPEQEAKGLFRQLIEALMYLESKEIVHRDIKCENVFLDKQENVKLGDFGFARYLRKGEVAKTFCGSRAYVAPEILRAISYEGNKTDIWSAGIVLFVMVTGVMPYDDRDPKGMLEKQLQHKIRFPSRVELSTPLKQYIFSILHPYPPNRPGCKELCQHQWIKETTPNMKMVDLNNNAEPRKVRRSSSMEKK